MKKTKFIFIICLLMSGFARAQQDPMYSMYMFNPMAINPAYTGTLDQMQVIALYRRQWLDFPGAPKTRTITFHGPVRNENMGIGLSLINDRIGKMNTSGFMATYAYQLRFERSRLAFGLQAGVRNFSVNLNEILLSPDKAYDESFANAVSQWSLNFGTGVFWYGKNGYVGLSIPHMRNTVLGDDLVNTIDPARLRTHYNLTGGYVFSLNPTFKLKPSIMIKTVTGSPVQIDLNANLYWLDVVALGASYRSGNAMVWMAEVQANQYLRIGYAFDQTINGLRGSVGGSHEIMVRCDMGFNKNKTVTPRYF
jgi:type IX secretion system PorP/SprF family membrane protein